MEQSDSPLLAFGLAVALGIIAYVSHRALVALRNGQLLAENAIPKRKNYWPFQSRQQAQIFQGTSLELLLLGLKWILGFAAVLLAIYPIIFLASFGEM